MPALFVGHGSPMNAIVDAPWTRGFATIGQTLPRPRAILSISAHWYVAGTFVTANDEPPTIHDFGGFAPELYEIQYPARGSGELCRRVIELVTNRGVQSSLEWGLDHGTWTVLHHMYPQADIPVVQLSIDRRLPLADHLAIGRALAPLRDEGVLVFATGNATHNLRHAFHSMQTGDTTRPAWAETFDREIADACTAHDTEHLTRAPTSEHGRMSHPTLDHYVPLLYAAGAADTADAVTFPTLGWDLGSLSMRSIQFGQVG
jgi:4,5-DOPA dioxygenase extradiol